MLSGLASLLLYVWRRQQTGRKNVKKLIAASLMATAVLGTSTAFGGESGRLLGESLDNGLGALPATYTGAEFMKHPAYHVTGEKMDSGLGSVSQEEVLRIISAYQRRDR
jgi:hypothetical protein